MREIQNFQPGISLLSFRMNTLARFFTREWQRHGENEFSLFPGPWKTFPKRSTEDCKGSPAPARLGEADEFLPQLRSAAEPVLCFPDGIAGERLEAKDADIVN